MKKFFSLALILILVMAGSVFATTVGDDMTYEGPVTFKQDILMDGNALTNVTRSTETLTAADTLTAAEAGKTIYLN